jgi:hypothetical protein
MPRCVTNLLEIVMFSTRTHTFLRRGGAPGWRRWLLVTEEYALELDHPSIGEEERGIVGRNERGAGKDSVAFALEEFEESGADFGRLHIALKYRRG